MVGRDPGTTPGSWCQLLSALRGLLQEHLGQHGLLKPPPAQAGDGSHLPLVAKHGTGCLQLPSQALCRTHDANPGGAPVPPAGAIPEAPWPLPKPGRARRLDVTCQDVAKPRWLRALRCLVDSEDDPSPSLSPPGTDGCTMGLPGKEWLAAARAHWPRQRSEPSLGV